MKKYVPKSNDTKDDGFVLLIVLALLFVFVMTSWFFILFFSDQFHASNSKNWDKVALDYSCTISSSNHVTCRAINHHSDLDRKFKSSFNCEGTNHCYKLYHTTNTNLVCDYATTDYTGTDTFMIFGVCYVK